MYILQLNYWRGPVDAWTLDQNIEGPGPRPPGSTPLCVSIINATPSQNLVVLNCSLLNQASKSMVVVIRMCGLKQ